jgi:hypothetical protein
MPVPAEAARSLVEVIERAATNPQVDIDKMERLLQMHERIRAADAEAHFNAAMSAAQAEMGRISTDATNSQTRSEYATYGKLDRTLRPIYTRHGFALSFSTATTDRQDSVRVTCTVSNGPHSRTYQIDMPADGKGAKGGDVMTKTHATGAAASYGMRYLLKMIFNVAIGEDDTDGNSVRIDPTDDGEAATESQRAYAEEFAAGFRRWLTADVDEDEKARQIAALQVEVKEDEKVAMLTWKKFSSAEKKAIKAYVGKANRKDR